MKHPLQFALLGGALVAAAALIGGQAAGVGGLVALVAQTGAVALLRPAMDGPQGPFFARWLGGMAIRALAIGALLAFAATHRAQILTEPRLEFGDPHLLHDYIITRNSH